MDFHYHIETHFGPMDGDPEIDVVDGCCPANELESFTRSRDAYLATSPILKVPGRYEDCVFVVHKGCYSSCWSKYRTPKGAVVVSPGRED